MGVRQSKDEKCKICTRRISLATANTRERGWQNLPPELIIKICGLLRQRDVTHFRGTCRSFNLAVKAQRTEWFLKPPRFSHDECLKYLVRAFPHLRVLSLRGCHRLTDYGATRALSNRTVPELDHIDLFNCSQLTDSFLVHLVKSFPAISFLGLSNCQSIGARGLAAIGTLTSLEYLDIALMSNLDDKGLWELAGGCINLKVLDVSGCRRITDNGLSMLLLGCPSLQKLRAVKSKITDAVRDEFPGVEFELSK